MRQPHTGHADPPQDHNDRDENARSQPFKQNVGQRLEAGVGDEEDGETGIVLAAGDVETLLEAVKLGVADVGAVEEGDEIEETKPGDQAEVELPEESAVLYMRSVFAPSC